MRASRARTGVRSLATVGIVLGMVSCTSGPEGSGGGTPAPPPREPPNAERAPALRGSHVASGWGSTGVVAAGGAAPYWVIAIVDVRASEDVAGVTLGEVEVLDARGQTLARGDRELELRETPADRAGQDFSAYGTEPFDGRVAPGARVRLRVHARLPDGFAESSAALPASYRATLRLASGATVAVEGPLAGPWPTA